MRSNVATLIFECFHLKQVKHEWRRLAGVLSPDSVAEHSLIAAQIGYFLATMEWVDAYQVVTMLVFHDLSETRIGDLHRVATRYLGDKHTAEKQVLHDQCDWKPWWEQICQLVWAFDARATPEAIVAKDADYLEQAFQAKIYVEQGYSAAQDRIKNVGNALQTKSAKNLRTDMQTMHSTDRWAKTNLKDLSKT